MITLNESGEDLGDKNTPVKKAWLTPDVEMINTDDIESGQTHHVEGIYNKAGSTPAFTHFVS
ncbi:hypothetical protein [Mucilaginibacter jinjuensis]|uniref:Uncharacterized protein n=1 Tax=Mucilaginibacter jinjuensis TaxID=1176721 RepID=A0ABY7T5H4_9SPHI|nr:hypothetical protein [Mucilaginibacter jinjuensis]WCT11061.1 hypothetical protein PQO05_20185 [Mucilaginibacter jinjuensis]